MRGVQATLLFWVAVATSACSNQGVAEIRRKAPGGGYWVERVKVDKSKKKTSQPKQEEGKWFGDMLTGSPRIRICLGEQKVYFYKGGQLAGVSPISSGREGMRTRTGKFAVTEKDIDHVSSLFGEYVDGDGLPLKRDVDVRKHSRPPGAVFRAAKMPFFMRVDGAIGMHEGYLPGYPASHGCIRLPHAMAEIFYRESAVGTPVDIVH